MSRYSFKERLLIQIAEHLGPVFIRFLGRFCRYETIGEQNLWNAHEAGNGAILALWHGRMLLPVYHFRRRGIVALVSLHRDGEFITRIVQRLGYIVRRGSPKEGGLEGFKAMLRDLRDGKIVAIFPDGPTGPRHSLHDGVLHLARMSGAPIVPMSFCAIPHWRVRSWDRFMIMKPLSKAKLMLHEPFLIPKKLSRTEVEEHRNLIISRLISVENDADDTMGLVGG